MDQGVIEARKYFFVEKKQQKTFTCLVDAADTTERT
jgi:hypothetical protein